jgi:hypothetical protein
MADDKSDFKPGSMDIREQEKTFVGFMKFVQWTTVAIVVILLFLALARV